MSLNTILSEFRQYWSRLAKSVKFFLFPEKLRNQKYDWLLNYDIYVYIYVSTKTRAAQHQKKYLQGPVVQSVVSLTSSLRVISFTVLADSIYNILIFFAEKM